MPHDDTGTTVSKPVTDQKVGRLGVSRSVTDSETVCGARNAMRYYWLRRVGNLAEFGSAGRREGLVLSTPGNSTGVGTEPVIHSAFPELVVAVRADSKLVA